MRSHLMTKRLTIRTCRKRYPGNASSTIRWQQRLFVECKARATEEEQDTEITFATVNRQIDRGLSTSCVEMSSPKDNILTAKCTN